jgi:hypothetical protein
MSTLATFANIAAAALLSPSGPVDGYYNCEDSVRWGSHYQATATASFAVGYEDRTTTRYRLTWAPEPSQAALAAVEWSSLPRDVESLPAPNELGFGIRMPGRMQGGTILLIPSEGELIQVPVRKPAVRHLKNMGTTWVTITDPAQRARLIEHGGSRFAAIDSNGKVAAQGPINLPDRKGMEIRYRPLAESLRAKAAAYETACIFEPVTETR